MLLWNNTAKERVNIDKRKSAANSFEKYFFKLMNNSTFGKTMKNLRKRMNIRILDNAGGYKKYVTNQVLFLRKSLVKI